MATGTLAARLLKPLTWLVLGLPLVWLGWAVAVEARMPGSVLGADPGEAVVLYLGEWGLRALLAALAVSPLRRLLNWPELARVRRLAGLFAFAYLSLHFLAYLALLAAFDWAAVTADFTERPYIIAGALGLMALVPLAVTSTRGWQRRLGRRWRSLHRLVFPAAALGVLHLAWLTKEGYGETLLYAVVLLALVGERVAGWLARQQARRRSDDRRSGAADLRAVPRRLTGGSGR